MPTVQESPPVTAASLERLKALAKKPGPESIRGLLEFLYLPPSSESRLFARIDISEMALTVSHSACAALVDQGKPGIDALAHAIRNSASLRFPHHVAEALWFAAMYPSIEYGHDWTRGGETYAKVVHTPEINAYARSVIQDLVAESQVDPVLFDALLSTMRRDAEDEDQRGGEHRHHGDYLRKQIFHLFAEGTIRVNKKLIRELRKLVDSRRPERDYQEFLARHPAFLDPIAAEVIPQQRLGKECVVDFVIRRHDSQYIVVEIEKPQDKIFTESGRFKAHFFHAFGQVLEYQDWVERNIEYARKSMPDISSPSGLLVMGELAVLTEEERSLLARFQANSRKVEIVTYDQLVTRAESLYQSVYGGPPGYSPG